MYQSSSTLLVQSPPWGDFGFAFSRNWCANAPGSVQSSTLMIGVRLPALVGHIVLGARSRCPRWCMWPRVRLITSTCSLWKKQVVPKPTFAGYFLLGTALEAKCASAGRVCLHQHLAVLPRTSSFLQGFAAAACSAPIAFTADSAVCSDFLPSLELSHRFPQCQKSVEP